MTDLQPGHFTESVATLGERCFDASLRVATIVHLETMTADTLSSDTQEFLTDHAELLRETFGWDLETEDDIEEWISAGRVTGWIIEVETPVRKPGGMFSWGHCLLHSFYGHTYEEAIEFALAWAEHIDGGGA